MYSRSRGVRAVGWLGTVLCCAVCCAAGTCAAPRGARGARGAGLCVRPQGCPALAPPMHRALWLLCLARVADAGRSRKKLSLEEEWQKLDEFCQTLASCDTCMDNAEVVNNKGCGWCMESEVTARDPGRQPASRRHRRHRRRHCA